MAPTRNKYYTGVGSRETPEEIGKIISDVAVKLEQLGYTLRSGGAGGADSYFAEKVKGKEIFIPWSSFGTGIVPEETDFAHSLLKEIHPAYDRLSQGALKLHLRNVNQVLGKDLNTPSDFLICWAKTDKQGVPMGGTRTAWKVAEKYNIPCFNLSVQEDFERVVKLIKTENMVNCSRVVHCKKEPFNVYIGRPSKWGNPFTHKQDGETIAKYIVGSRDEAVEAYREWITNGEGKHLLEDLHELEGQVLGCWCHPKSCHGDILSELVSKRNF